LTRAWLAALQAAFSPHAKDIMADVPNYTDLSPVTRVSEVIVGQPQLFAG